MDARIGPALFPAIQIYLRFFQALEAHSFERCFLRGADPRLHFPLTQSRQLRMIPLIRSRFESFIPFIRFAVSLSVSLPLVPISAGSLRSLPMSLSPTLLIDDELISDSLFRLLSVSSNRNANIVVTRGVTNA